MVGISQLGWGKYGGYEGPYFKGSIPYKLPDNPTEDDRRVRVVTSTEGGAYDAINMYDKCIVSVGLIQWCEAQYYLTSRLLHEICNTIGPAKVLLALKPAFDLYNADFKPNVQKQWRFHFNDARGEVNTLQKQQDLFLGCNGKEGMWTPEARGRAQLWAACLTNVWSDPLAQRVQVKYTAQRLMGFVLKDAKQALWDGTADVGWTGALRAAYLSFAANNTVKANDSVIKAMASLKSPKWSAAWCTGVLKQLTFGPGVAIYGERYNKIRPWLEQLWTGVTLPKTADELKAWTEPVLVIPVPKQPATSPPPPDEPFDMPVIPPPASVPVVTIDPPKVSVAASAPEEVNSSAPHATPVPQFRTGFLGFILQILAKIFQK